MSLMDPDDDSESAPRLPMLLQAVLSVGTELELRATLQHLVDSATQLIGARYGALGVVDPERGRLTELFTAGMTDAERARIPRLPDGHSGLLGVLVEDPQPLRLDDLTADPRSCGMPEGHPAMHSFLGVPIRVHTEVFGNLYLTEKHGGGPFTEEDLSMLRVLASQAGIAIGNARLYETVRQRERWIEGAAAVTTALLAGEPAADALTTVAERARILADASAGVVLQPTPEGGMEIVAASTVDDPGDLVGTAITPGSPVLVQLLGGEPVFVEDSATDPRMTTHVRSRFGPSMMLPLQSGGRLIGTLALPRRRGGRPYTAVDRLLASQFASQAALALVLADAQHNREQLAVYEDRDRIARDLHDLVVQRLFATEMMLESTRRRAAAETGSEPHSARGAGGGADVEEGGGSERPASGTVPGSPTDERPGPGTGTGTGPGSHPDERPASGTVPDSPGSERPGPGVDVEALDDTALLGRAVDELDSTIQEVRTAIFALQQPPADAPTTFRGRVLRETDGAAVLLGFPPSVRFTGAVDALVEPADADRLLAALRSALAAAHRRPGLTAIRVEVTATPDGPRLRVTDDGHPPTTVEWP
ncbi:GAF domain-containing protein [Streptomyces sp. NPDC090127]|uniref:GAF domain-containing protein n=1 Tax=Streptomyces sp. NPDC090127 TaxID=3365953 RepID=UPI0037FADE2F